METQLLQRQVPTSRALRGPGDCRFVIHGALQLREMEAELANERLRRRRMGVAFSKLEAEASRLNRTQVRRRASPTTAHLLRRHAPRSAAQSADACGCGHSARARSSRLRRGPAPGRNTARNTRCSVWRVQFMFHMCISQSSGLGISRKSHAPSWPSCSVCVTRRYGNRLRAPQSSR